VKWDAVEMLTTLVLGSTPRFRVELGSTILSGWGLKPPDLFWLEAALECCSSIVVPAILGECLFGSVMVSGIAGVPSASPGAGSSNAQDDKAWGSCGILGEIWL
jgi:hypothetical protein